MANRLGLTSEHLEVAYEGTLDAGRTDWYNHLLDKAVRQLVGQLPGLAARLDSASVDYVDTVKDVVTDAVLRVIRNPEGINQEGEGNYSYSRHPTVASGDVWFPEKDLRKIGFGDRDMVPRTGRVRPTHGWAFP